MSSLLKNKLFCGIVIALGLVVVGGFFAYEYSKSQCFTRLVKISQ
ncbi:MAG: hypothetical protein Q4C00_03110 [Bacillota bacterium]|nr:hypothetical protein [Bacillota bacterium]